MPKSPYSGALEDNMRAIQPALLYKPERVFDLLAFGRSLASDVTTTVFDLSQGRPPNCPSKPEGLELSNRLTPAPAEHEAWSRPELQRLHCGRKDSLQRRLGRGYGADLPHGADNADFFALIEGDSGTSIRTIWTPTAENGFNRVSADTLDKLHLGRAHIKTRQHATTQSRSFLLRMRRLHMLRTSG